MRRVLSTFGAVINPPSGHVRFAGTITLPQDVFARVLEMQSSTPSTKCRSCASAAAADAGLQRVPAC
jgi:hypothetical protein